ncbi:hypothetical protein BV22DRAFT_929991 [Leucogyrophana mollusca]|uniref:Uncharacterized protein n=1 Tax=Leucogyrophana mollusca TaxID=85980 RepID=A0ACB8AWX6_9AGAM|nr:hypothetical protein BV22DRAFT_929991 [Leucogyrophana mollusca]
MFLQRRWIRIGIVQKHTTTNGQVRVAFMSQFFFFLPITFCSASRTCPLEPQLRRADLGLRNGCTKDNCSTARCSSSLPHNIIDHISISKVHPYSPLLRLCLPGALQMEHDIPLSAFNIRMALDRSTPILPFVRRTVSLHYALDFYATQESILNTTPPARASSPNMQDPS